MLSDAEMIIVLIICDRIVYLIVYPCDHCVDHLLTQSTAFCTKCVFVDVTSSSLTSRKWSKQEKMRQGY